MHQQTIRNYSVQGMTCEHCRLAVAEEVGEIAGVDDVAVELATGALAVQGSSFTDDEVAAAVAEAGYSIAR